jgi:hypothetical protein
MTSRAEPWLAERTASLLPKVLPGASAAACVPNAFSYCYPRPCKVFGVTLAPSTLFVSSSCSGAIWRVASWSCC